MSTSDQYEDSDAIAIIGMAGRFPGAGNVNEYWQNLIDGVESISALTEEELLSSGIDSDVFRNPNYVRAAGILEGIELFDASFFGFTAREAEITDPQQRLFLECAWEALENACCDSETYKGRIGVYAGSRMSTYLIKLYSNQELIRVLGSYRTLMGNDKDYLPTWTSYKINLRGPSVAVQTACSTSLVAVHQACQSLLNGECDVGLAGGASIFVPEKAGYVYQEGGITSPDGHCRAFDAKAQGTVRGSGVGVVVLKRLVDALADGDYIHAIIKGSAINNDGSLKVGFTAPSVEGQADVIAEAQALARVRPESITYIEAHGTGTVLGDPIEIEALTRVFRASTNKKQFCGVGSVKTNVGHLDAAAGVASLIKTTMALEHKVIPPSLHFEQPNPIIDFDNGPFYVNSRLREWKADGAPRRAGVSSFGIGGTNAHIVLEEAPARPESGPSTRYQLLVLSAKTASALETATTNLVEYLDRNATVNLADVAHTLQVGRRPFEHRRVLVCEDRENAVKLLQARTAKRVLTSFQRPVYRSIVFMFPGQGTQYANMGLELYRDVYTFREQIDLCSKLLQPHLGFDLREVLYPGEGRYEAAALELNQTAITQPALFVIEYALAKLWMHWGVLPDAMIGHSIGEYVAACLAGVFTLEDALALVAARGRLIQQIPSGAMLAVRLSEKQLQPLLGERLSLAAVNGPANCVASGSADSVDELERYLGKQGFGCRPLRTSHAFHSEMMEPTLQQFLELARQVQLNPPRIPFISNVTGKWISNSEATDAGYWVRHLRKTVRFGDGVSELLKEPERILLEVGPGQTLSMLAKQQLDKSSAQVVLSSSGGSRSQSPDLEFLLGTLGRLWLAGTKVDWFGFSAGQRRLRVQLPTYPFERKRYWFEASGLTKEKTLIAKERGDAHSFPFSAEAPNPNILTRQAGRHMPQMEAATKATTRRDVIISMLKSSIRTLTGLDPEAVDTRATFFELGADSLLLIQVAHTIQDKFGIKIPFRLLFEDLSTIDGLADYLDRVLPPESLPMELPSEELVFAAQARPTEQQSYIERNKAITHDPLDGNPSKSSNGSEPVSPKAETRATADGLDAILSQQLQVVSHLMTQQLDLLRERRGVGELPPSLRPERVTYVAQPGDGPLAGTVSVNAGPPANGAALEPHIAYRPIEMGQKGGLTPRQRQYLDSFIERYTKRTQRSKLLTQAYRDVLAEPRASLGFRLLWKEIIYPIIAERSYGSKILDVDGNEYVDLAMGFGVNLFGHSPAFITEALQEQLKRGIHIGPQSDLAGEVAGLIRELTGAERAVFCNSGTEAVMAALRIARTVTRRTTIVLFSGSYHGTFDGVLAKAVMMEDGKRVSVPLSPGTPRGMIQDVLVLAYDDPKSLEIIKARAHELAAVLVEPVQSRRPDVQPEAFLREVRRLTEESGTALIFDEVVTGFRSHPGGAQALFGVRADIVTYGKVVGGGLPMGVVAGKASYLDAIDGGAWNYGDESYPQAEQTFFAGTFCKHPLAMAAAKAILNRLKESGPQLQQQLNQRTSYLAEALNAYFKQEQVPLLTARFGSLLYFIPSRSMKTLDLFFYHLIDKGVYNWEGRTCFISTAHTDEDIDHVIGAVKQSVEELRGGGFLTDPTARPSEGNISVVPRLCSLPVEREKPISASSLPSIITSAEPNGDQSENVSCTLPLTEVQRQLWFLSQLGSNISGAYHESATLKLRGLLNLEAMGTAIRKLVERHDVLRTTFSKDGDYQQIHSAVDVLTPIIDFSDLDASARESVVEQWINSEIRRPFDLTQGPLLRVRILKLEEQYHYLLIVTHHIITDGRSYGVLLQELNALYESECRHVPCKLLKPMQFGEYAALQATWQQSADLESDEAYWEGQFADTFPVLELPTDHPRTQSPAGNGARYRVTIDEADYKELKNLSSQQGCTMFVTLLAGFNLLLHELSSQDDIVVGINVAQQLSTGSRDFIGFRINPLSLRSKTSGGQKASDYLCSVKETVLNAYEHQNVSVNKLNKNLKARRDTGRLLLVSAAFNLDQGGGTLNFFGLQTSIVSNHNGYAVLDIYLNAVDKRDRLLLECDYNRDLFDEKTIERWMDHLRIIMKAIAADPSQPLSRLPSFIRQLSPADETEPLSSYGPLDVYESSNLTKYQRLIWAGQKLEPGVAMYINAGYSIIPASVDREHYQKAFQKLIDNSDALRTIIEEVDSKPQQRVVESFPYQVEYIDLSQASDPQAKLRAWAHQRCRVPFDLQSRLFDVALIKLADDEFAQYINVHHIVTDAWSVSVIIRLISRYYGLSLRGRLDESPVLPLFQDYVANEREYLESPRAARSAAYWKEKLAEEIEPLNFYGKTTIRRSTGVQRVSIDLGAKRTQALNSIAGREEIFAMSIDVTMHNIFAALVFAYLCRITGNRRISLGDPFHNRRSKEEAIGLFMQILPLRVTIDEESTFLSLIDKVGKEHLKVLRHSEYPIGNPIQRQAYEVEYNYITAKNPDSFNGVPVKDEWLHPGNGHESLTIQIHQGSSGSLICEFDFHCDVFDEPLRHQATDHFLQVVDAFLENEAQPLKSFSLLSDDERRRILVEFNSTEMAFPRERTFIGLFEDQVQRTPNRIAVSSGNRQLTYAQLNASANRLGRHLVARGVGPEVVVALLAERTIDFLTAILAVYKAGGAYLPLDPSSPAERLSQVLNQSQCGLILAEQSFIANLTEALLNVSSQGPTSIAWLEELLQQQESEENMDSFCMPANLAYIIYTSGSTGVPKGAMIEHSGMLNHLYVKVRDLRLTQADVIAQTASQCFDISVWQFLASLLVGGEVHIAGDEIAHNPQRLQQEVMRRGITILEMVPSLLRAMLEEERELSKDADDSRLETLRWLLVTGEAVPPVLCRQWLNKHPEIPMLNAYGPTECSDDVTQCEINEPPPNDIIRMPIGRPVGNLRIYVVDRGLELLPIGMAGEICVGGVGVGRGYLSDPKRTAEVFVADPFALEPGARLYRTGDLGRYLPDNIEYLGRIDHQVKVRGFRIELSEIEAVLSAHPGVSAAVVTVREDVPGDKRLVAYIVAGQEVPSISNLRSFIEAKLPKYMIPYAFLMLDALPLTPNGKVDRTALPAPDSARPELEGAFVAPRNHMEELLTKIWGQVLNLKQIGIHDNFFELGGDSILTIQIAAKAHKEGIRIAPMQMFEHQTIAELAAVAGTSAVVNAEQGIVLGEVPLTPIQHWFFQQELPNPHHWNQAAMFEMTEVVDPVLLEQAVQGLLEHHDALRLRFRRSPSGWQQSIAGLEEQTPFSRFDFSQLPETERKAAIEDAASELQASLNIERGPLIRVALFDLGIANPARLLICVHHLAIDGVSWRILPEDLHTIYQQLSHGKPVEMPLKTSSFKQWSERLTEYAQSEELRRELDYWLRPACTEDGCLPVDFSEGINTKSSVRTISKSLNVEQTRSLLQDVPKSHQAQINGVLLAALARTLVRWTGLQSTLIEMEGHGREDLFEDITLSRTVGWFTSIFPIRLTLDEASTPLEILKSVQLRLNNIPNRGIGYGLLRYLTRDAEIAERLRSPRRADVSFNYLGQFDQVISEGSLFRPARESAGLTGSRQGNRIRLLDISGIVVEGQLRLEWTYSENVHRQDTIENLAETYMVELRSLISHCLSSEAPNDESDGPPDFEWSRNDLDEINAVLSRSKGSLG